MITLWNVFNKAERLRNSIYWVKPKPIRKINYWPDGNRVSLQYDSREIVHVYFHENGRSIEPFCDSCKLNQCYHVLDAIIQLENEIQHSNPFTRDCILGRISNYLDLFEKSKEKILFGVRMAIGNSAKDVVRILLEISGYEVQPFGYENLSLRLDPKTRGASIDKIKSMPDIIVDGELVEVKYRNKRPEKVYIDTKKVKRMLKCWPEALLVIVVPYDKVFYIITLEDLSKFVHNINGEIDFNLMNEPWLPIENFFTKINPETLDCFRDRVKIRFGRP